MKTKIFERWNWEFDYGVSEIASGKSPPADHAVASYDQHGRLYRVELRTREPQSEESKASVTAAYDYFCAEDGRVLQKRSLGDSGEVYLIVDMHYSEDTVTEIAWWPGTGVSKSLKRDIERPPPANLPPRNAPKHT